MHAYARIHIRPRPRSPHTPPAQTYEDYPGPATATSPHDPTTPTHAHSSPQGHVHAQRQWLQRWMHTQLWELQSGPGQSPPSRAWSTGPARGRRRTAASSRRGAGCHMPHGKPCWPMRYTPSETRPTTSARPRTTRMSSGACRRPCRREEEKAGACGRSPQVQPCAQTLPHHPASVDAQTPASPTAPREPREPHSTTRLTPSPAAPPPNPATQPASAAECHAEPRPEETKRTGSRRTPTRTQTGTATPSGTEPKPAAVETATAQPRRRPHHESKQSRTP